MKKVFSELKKKLTRRERKGKPTPVPAPVRLVWDEDDLVFKGKSRSDDQYVEGVILFGETMRMDPTFVHMNEKPWAERRSPETESASGYDYPRETFQAASEPSGGSQSASQDSGSVSSGGGE